MCRMYQLPARIGMEVPEQQLNRSQPRDGKTFIDFPRLLGDVQMYGYVVIADQLHEFRDGYF